MGKAISPRPSSSTTGSICLTKPSPKSITISRKSDDDESGLSELLLKLKSVVPAVSGKHTQELTSLDIMQHAIDYIYDLSATLSDMDSEEENEVAAVNNSTIGGWRHISASA